MTNIGQKADSDFRLFAIAQDHVSQPFSVISTFSLEYLSFTYNHDWLTRGAILALGSVSRGPAEIIFSFFSLRLSVPMIGNVSYAGEDKS